MRHVSTTKVRSSRKPRVCDGCLSELGIGSSLVKFVNSEGGKLFTTFLCIPCDTFWQQNPDAVDYEWFPGDIGEARWCAEQDERADNWGEWHQKSQQAIADGDLALALECEVKAIESLDPKNQARSLGITVVSACAIAYRARNFSGLRKIADKWIPVISQGFADEVKQILLDASTATAEAIHEPEAIQLAINAILDSAVLTVFNCFSINWADLSCTEVAKKGNGFEAIIKKEASPGDPQLAEWVEGELLKRGWANVKVKTKW